MWDTIKCTIIHRLGGIERSRKNVGISNGPKFPQFDGKNINLHIQEPASLISTKRFTPSYVIIKSSHKSYSQ